MLPSDRLLISEDEFKVADQEWSVDHPPVEWRSVISGIWRNLISPDALPFCGWKVHVSAKLSDAQIVLGIVSNIAYQQGCSFKYLRSPSAYRHLHSKNGSRFQSGKFIALYPRNLALAKLLMDEIYGRIRSFEGIDILTDRSFKGSTNLFYRWGAYVNTGRVNEDGDPEELVEDGCGNLVPDIRAAHFILPEGIEDPFSSLPSKTRKSVDKKSIPFDQYIVEEALRYTNAGGRYRAVCQETGLDVFLKEARPHTGFIGAHEAREHLKSEVRFVERINETFPNLAPRILKRFSCRGHDFVAFEFKEGTLLSEWIASENPLYSAQYADEQSLLQYMERATQILKKVRSDLNKIHSLDIAFGDLSVSNVIVDRDDVPHLIDFEACLDAQTLAFSAGTPDFCLLDQAGKISARERDEYAFHSISVALVLRLTSIAEVSPHVLPRLTEELQDITETMPQWWFDACSHLEDYAERHSKYRVSEFSGLQLKSQGDVRDVLSALEVGLLASQCDTGAYLFPTGGVAEKGAHLSFCSGDSGIVGSLASYGRNLDVNLRNRFETSVRDALVRDRPALGLAHGLAGAAYTCSLMGNHDLAEEVASFVWDSFSTVSSPCLATGLAGIAVVFERIGKREAAIEILHRAILQSDSYTWEKNGLGFGRSGLAAAILQCATSFAELPHIREVVANLLLGDIDQLVWGKAGENASLRGEVDGERLLPYISDGSAGLAFALVLARGCEELSSIASDELLLALAMDMSTPFTLEASLLDGAAGLCLVLELMHRKLPHLSEKLPSPNWERLSKYLLPFGGGVGVINPRNLRYDFSYAQGSAGILSALRASRQSTPFGVYGLSV